MSQNLRDFTKALYQFDAVVQRVPEAAWGNQSPCDEWCARDVVVHEASVINAVGHMARTNEVVMPEMAEGVDDPVQHWNEARDNIIETLDHPGVLNQQGSYWWGPQTIDQLVGFTAWDPLTHAWDLSQAAGLDHVPDQQLAAQSLALVGDALPTLQQFGLVADPVEVDTSADPMSQFLAKIGRNPGA